MSVDPDQVRILAILPPKLLQDFLDVGCAQPEAQLLTDIFGDAKAGLIDEAGAKARIDEFCNTERTKATWAASMGWGAGLAVGGADIIQMANEASNAVLAHPVVVAAMDMLAGGIAAAAVGTGVIFSIRLGRLPSRRSVLRRCARTLVRGVKL